MKKIILVSTMLLAMMLLSGCGSENNEDRSVDEANYNTPEIATLFLVDEEGFAYADVPYKCDSMYAWSTTAPDGAFSFVHPDSCLFDFEGLDGTYGDRFDDIVRIVDEGNEGQGDISYECASFGISSTYSDGSFEYGVDDVCIFQI